LLQQALIESREMGEGMSQLALTLPIRLCTCRLTAALRFELLLLAERFF